VRLTEAQRQEIVDSLPTVWKAARVRAAWRRNPDLAHDYVQEAVLGYGDVIRGGPVEPGTLGRRAHKRCLGRMKDFDEREGREVPTADDALHEMMAAIRPHDMRDDRTVIREGLGARFAEVAARDEGAGADPEEEVGRKLVRERIRAIIADMAERDQMLLLPFVFERLTREEVAERVGKEVSWCNKMLADALRRLCGHIVREGLVEAGAEVVPFQARRAKGR